MSTNDNKNYRPPSLIDAAREVEQWWLNDGKHAFTGAPACMFSLREAIEAYEPPAPRAGDDDPDRGQRCTCGSWSYQHEEGTGPCIQAGCDCTGFSVPRVRERDQWQVLQTSPGESRSVFDNQKRLIANVINGDLAQQIVTEHNQHAILTDRLAAQTELLAKVVSERNGLREQRERLMHTLRKLMIRFEQTGEAWMSDPAMVEARELIATIEREGEVR